MQTYMPTIPTLAEDMRADQMEQFAAVEQAVAATVATRTEASSRYEALSVRVLQLKSKRGGHGTAIEQMERDAELWSAQAEMNRIEAKQLESELPVMRSIRAVCLPIAAESHKRAGMIKEATLQLARDHVRRVFLKEFTGWRINEPSLEAFIEAHPVVRGAKDACNENDNGYLMGASEAVIRCIQQAENQTRSLAEVIANFDREAKSMSAKAAQMRAAEIEAAQKAADAEQKRLTDLNEIEQEARKRAGIITNKKIKTIMS